MTFIFDITIDGVSQFDLADWIKNNPNLGIPKWLEINNQIFIIHNEFTYPTIPDPNIYIDYSMPNSWERIKRSQGVTEKDIQEDKIIRQREDDDINWNNYFMGEITILKFPNGSQVIGQAYEYADMFREVATRIKKTFRDKAHDNLGYNPNPIIENQNNEHLTSEEIEYRKGKVEEANEMKKANPVMTWKLIAKKIEIPERTLRYWRHEPKYQ